MNPKTLPQSRNGSRDTQVDVLFARLGARYGSLWLDRWVGIPLAAVKAEWAQALDRFDSIQIRQAVEWCGKFPPTLPEFIDLCQQAPRPFVAPVPGPQQIEKRPAGPVAMPDHIREQLRAFVSKTTKPTSTS